MLRFPFYRWGNRVWEGSELFPWARPLNDRIRIQAQILSKCVFSHQAPLSLYYSGKNTGVGCHFLLLEIFLTQGSHPRFLRLLNWQADSLPLIPPREPDSLQVKVKSLSRVRLFATLWTVAYHAPPSMGFFRREYWSGLPFPSPDSLQSQS